MSINYFDGDILRRFFAGDSLPPAPPPESAS
jgi:hypothetical protein